MEWGLWAPKRRRWIPGEKLGAMTGIAGSGCLGKRQDMVPQRARGRVAIEQGHLEEAWGWLEACWAPLSSSSCFLAFRVPAVPTGAPAETQQVQSLPPWSSQWPRAGVGGSVEGWEMDSAQLRSNMSWGSGPSASPGFVPVLSLVAYSQPVSPLGSLPPHSARAFFRHQNRPAPCSTLS